MKIKTLIVACILIALGSEAYAKGGKEFPQCGGGVGGWWKVERQIKRPIVNIDWTLQCTYYSDATGYIDYGNNYTCTKIDNVTGVQSDYPVNPDGWSQTTSELNELEQCVSVSENYSGLRTEAHTNGTQAIGVAYAGSWVDPFIAIRLTRDKPSDGKEGRKALPH